MLQNKINQQLHVHNVFLTDKVKKNHSHAMKQIKFNFKILKKYISSYVSGQDDTVIGYPSEQDVAILSNWDCQMCLQES